MTLAPRAAADLTELQEEAQGSPGQQAPGSAALALAPVSHHPPLAALSPPPSPAAHWWSLPR